MLKRSYAISDFSRDYFSYKGNAYGLANTLMQVPACAAVSTRVRVHRRIVGRRRSALLFAVLCFGARAQTAVFKPRMKGRLSNLYFAGQLTNPG